MAITRRTQQLVDKQQSTNKRRRAIESLQKFSQMFVALQDRKRAIAKEEEELKLAQAESNRRERESDAKISGDAEGRAIDRFRATTAAGNLTNAEARLLLDQEKHLLDEKTEARLWQEYLHSVSEAGKPKVFAQSKDEKRLKEVLVRLDKGDYRLLQRNALNMVGSRGSSPSHHDFGEQLYKVADEILFGRPLTVKETNQGLTGEGELSDIVPSNRPAFLRAFVEDAIKNASELGHSIPKGVLPLISPEVITPSTLPEGIIDKSAPSEFDKILQGL